MKVDDRILTQGAFLINWTPSSFTSQILKKFHASNLFLLVSTLKSEDRTLCTLKIFGPKYMECTFDINWINCSVLLFIILLLSSCSSWSWVKSVWYKDKTESFTCDIPSWLSFLSWCTSSAINRQCFRSIDWQQHTIPPRIYQRVPTNITVETFY